jgi:dedicator of cytokinesis protein 1
VIKHSEIVDEITAILKEWTFFFEKFFLVRYAQWVECSVSLILFMFSQTSNPGFQAIRQKMLGLIKLRAQILSGNLPADAIKDIKLLATTEIDTGNKLLGLDMVVRDESGNILEITSTSTTELYDHHMQAIERIRLAVST